MKQQLETKPYPQGNSTMYAPNDDISLKELIKVLWDSKLMIILITTVFAVGSVIFVFSAQEWWVSSAKISRAQPQDLTTYQQQVNQFQPVFNLHQDDGTVLVSKELDNLFNSSSLYQRFIDTFNSSNNKRNFLDENIEFQVIKDTLSSDMVNLQEDDGRLLYTKWFKKITAVSENNSGESSPYFLNFKAPTKESSFALLTSYISYTESKVHQDAFNNLQAVVNGKKNELVQQKNIIENQAKNQLKVEIERANYAMGIAKAAGVEQPIQAGDDNELFSIKLGSKGLEAKIVALESIKNLSVIEPRLQQISAKLNMLKNLEIDREVEFQTFRFFKNVEQPVTRDQPKRALIVILSALSGGILALVIVLIRFAFRKEG
ncbi:LPS O-antigen chain length determinant protein WzzB [Vibrio lentus]|uniref:LPS O-antigen chain length determinant protein WzzB n=1 Tax=Vibrio lentus TaxID=136468 RepID=UPI0018E44AF3|nr:Wzz/FepE/Etk N-terminal domain-containing protein [Vibrio lentus]